MRDGIVEGLAGQKLHRLEAEDNSPETRPDGSERSETQRGKSVRLEAAITDSANAGQPSLDTLPSGGNLSGSAAEEISQQADAMNPGDMQNLMDDFDRAYRMPRRGDTIEGVVVRIDKDGIMVDIGTKSEGIIPSHDLQGLSPEFLQQMKIGDEILVYVVQPENQNGYVVLSLKRARAEQGWRLVQKRFEEGQTVEAEVIDFNKGGLIASVDGVRGFVPISQVVGLRNDRVSEEELEKRMAVMIGKRIPLKVIEVNRSRNRLILSERLATQEIRVQRKEQLLSELHEGEVRHGVVSSVCDFGAFVDLGGADGLVHLSELSWSQVSHPSEVVKVGDEVDVYVLGVDQEKRKIALSLRRSQPGPWDKIADKYKVGDLVTGTVTKLTTFGAFARIEDGVEGLIHVSELGEGRIPHPRNVVKEGDVLTLRVIRIDPTHRKLGLSLKQAQGMPMEAAAPEVTATDVEPEQNAEPGLAGATADVAEE